MKGKISRAHRRIGVIVNYCGLFAFVALFHIYTDHISNVIVLAGMIAALVITIISFIRVHVSTRLWSLVHTKTDKLDEREILVTHESLRYSYSILSVLLLIIIFLLALFWVNKGQIGAVLPASLIYFAHTLPSSVIAWNEKVV